jgi:hypothetical protein
MQEHHTNRFPGNRIMRFWNGTERRPYGTPGEFFGFAHPALKRGANNHCAYGAGDEPLPGWSDSTLAHCRCRHGVVLYRRF